MYEQGTGVDPKVDYVFKRICGDEDQALITVDVVNAVVGFHESQRVRGVYIKNPFVAKDFAEGKVPVLDVRASDDPGRQFLLEMQQIVRGGFTKRLLYYWAGGHADQLLKGERYELLQPTYTICFVNETLFDDDDYHHCFVPYDKKNGQLLCRDLEVHVLELNKFQLTADEVKTPLERWCYFFKHGATLDPRNLPATLDVPIIRQAMEVLVRISQSELERQRYLERQRAERDAASFAADFRAVQEEARAAQEGARAAEAKLRVAEEKARAAEAKGIRIGRIQLLQQLLTRPEMSSEELGKLPDAELLQLEASLQQQYLGTKPANGTHADSP